MYLHILQAMEANTELNNLALQLRAAIKIVSHAQGNPKAFGMLKERLFLLVTTIGSPSTGLFLPGGSSIVPPSQKIQEFEETISSYLR